MKKNSYTCGSKPYLPASVIVSALVLGALFFLLRLPPKTEGWIISNAYEGKYAFYIKNRMQELKDSGRDLSKCVFILGDSTAQNFEEELAGYGARTGTKFICFYRQAFTLVDYFFIVSAVMPLKPKEIVVCVNLATFSPIYENPSYRFPEMISLGRPDLIEANIQVISRYYGMPPYEVRRYEKAKEESRFYMLLLGARKIARDWITENIEKPVLGRRTTEEMTGSPKQASLFLATYKPDAGSITEDHPYFALIRAMCELAAANNQKLLFYITPFDVGFMKDAGIFKEIEPSTSRIKSLLLKAMNGNSGILYDFSDRLPEDDIVDTPGHLRRSGREKIYKLLWEQLNAKR